MNANSSLLLDEFIFPGVIESGVLRISLTCIEHGTLACVDGSTHIEEHKHLSSLTANLR